MSFWAKIAQKSSFWASALVWRGSWLQNGDFSAKFIEKLTTNTHLWSYSWIINLFFSPQLHAHLLRLAKPYTLIVKKMKMSKNSTIFEYKHWNLYETSSLLGSHFYTYFCIIFWQNRHIFILEVGQVYHHKRAIQDQYVELDVANARTPNFWPECQNSIL